MNIEVKTLGHIAANCYMISTDKSAIVVDPGKKSPVVDGFFQDNSDKEKIILLTHCHFDHILGADDLRKKFSAKIAIGEKDEPGLRDTVLSFSDKFHAKQKPFSADIMLNDNDNLAVGDLTVKVFETPGHSYGGVCYLIEDCLFSGDTLFLGSVGITENEEGFNILKNSILRLYTLPDNTKVLPGHGDFTTIGKEKLTNEFVRGN